MENKPDIYEKITEQNEEVLGYSRKRFLGTWLAIAVLALLICVLALTSLRTASTNLDQNEDIARVANTTADEAEQSTDDITAYLRGEQGIPGVPGESGQTGTPGLPSSEPGPKGDKGDTGTSGSSGPTGAMGSTGSSGPLGGMGPAGSDGVNGEQGSQGENGTTGEQGPKGDKGDQGAQGPKGDTGPAGPAGTAPPLAPPNTTVAVGQSVNDPNTPKTAQATCPAGSRASGGGFAIAPSDPGLIVTASSPVGNTGWNATVEELSLPAATNWQVLVFAICVS